MHHRTAFLLASLLALFSPSTSAPQEPSATPAAACIVPEIILTTIGNPFTLEALVVKAGSIPFSVQLPPPSAKTATQPYISRTKIAQPLFRLTGGNFTTGGANHKKFPASFGPTIEIFPPVLQPLLFGGGEAGGVKFSAGYACDAAGKLYLELRTFEPFAVPKLAEGEKIYGKPKAYVGDAVTVHLKINEQ